MRRENQRRLGRMPWALRNAHSEPSPRSHLTPLQLFQYRCPVLRRSTTCCSINVSTCPRSCRLRTPYPTRQVLQRPRCLGTPPGGRLGSPRVHSLLPLSDTSGVPELMPLGVLKVAASRRIYWAGKPHLMNTVDSLFVLENLLDEVDAEAMADPNSVSLSEFHARSASSHSFYHFFFTSKIV
jgi:hypothetical protein